MGCESVLVVGVGNRLYGDDGAGSCLAESLRRCHPELNVEVHETLSFWETGIFEGRLLVVIADAVNAQPLGSPKLYKLEPRALPPEEVSSLLYSADPHDASPALLVTLAHAAGVLKGDCYLLGIPAARVELGFGLSEEALRAMALALPLLERLLSRYGCSVNLKRDCLENAFRECGAMR
ncbi:MAG: hydrogenase maturation protease [Thermofilum sp.]